MASTNTRPPAQPPRRQRSDGERSRAAILREAAQLATVEGISGLSIGRLADAVGMSKSGLFAHFGSKEDLQLATIDTASVLFGEQVIETASAASSGLERLRLLTEGFLQHVEDDVFPGGCFFASVAAEMDTHPGPVRDRAVQVVEEWMQRLIAAAREAQDEDTISSSEDAEQLAFELNAYLLLANAQFVVSRDPVPMRRARTALKRRLTAAAA
ncbi:MAG TPA: TetR/AcrR family transcriptional regulator [Solirubrobacteraceae bacterium]|jgi:AcrR family transcriptional regulator